MRQYYTPIWMAKIKIVTTSSTGKGAEKVDLHTWLVGIQNDIATLKIY